MEDSFSIFAEMLISKIFDYYLKEKIFPKRETDGKLVVYKADGKFDVYVDGFVEDAIKKDEQFESSTIRLLIAILKVNLGGKTGVNYESTMHQVFFMAQSKKNEDIYIKVDDSANIDVGIFFKTEEGKILIPFEVKTGNKWKVKEITDVPKYQEEGNGNQGTFPKMKGSVPGILAYTDDVNLKFKGSDEFVTKYLLFGLKKKPDGIQNNIIIDIADIVNTFKGNQYFINNQNDKSVGFICRHSKKLDEKKFQRISLETLFSEFAEQYFKDRFVEEEKIFANTLKHLKNNIEVCWGNYRRNYIDVCLDKIDKNNESDYRARVKKFNELIKNFNSHFAKFFINRKISDPYEEFFELNVNKILKNHISEEEFIKAISAINYIVDIQNCFNGVFELREKRIEAEFNNYVHHFLNTIETDFYNKWVKK